ncbi:Exosome complex exonuclease RRP44 homolog A [Linum perenne]
MLHSKTFSKKTRGGKVQKLVREVYLRDDIYCGASFCKVCDTTSARLTASASTLLVLDTNVVLNQIDLLENPAIDDVVVLSIVLQEVKNKNTAVYNRIRALCSNPARRYFVFSNEFHRDTYVQTMTGETPNDRNDRAIRVATRWYQKHLGDVARVLLVTNDKENKRKATEEGVSAETIESYVQSLAEPALLDLLVQPASEDVAMEEAEDLRPSKRKVVYPEHKPISEITSGLANGIYHQGKLRVNRYNPFEAYVGSESIERGTSVYLVERRIDMLPKPLTEDICSLRADVERLAFSVIWEMTPEAEIISTKYTKSVIKSCAALSYVEAQARMDDSRLMDPVTEDLRRMNTLAKIMRQRRIARGALTLASAEVKFQIDTETHDPLDIGMYQIREANQMVEEFMLAANVSVAEQILKHFSDCSLLRRHPSPTKDMLEPLLRTAAAIGLNLDVSSSKALADSLDHAVGDDPYFNKLIRIMATRCMSQAVYFCSGDLSPPEFHHYGLASPLYTHFTSPIRRYADVVVHRLLAASLGIYTLPLVFRDRPQLTSIADNLNYRHRNAQMASRGSVELHTLIYFRNRPTDTEARIVKIRSNGFIVFVPKYGIEGPVYLSPKSEKGSSGGGGEWFVDEQQQKIKKMDGSVSYGILQAVKIHLEVVEPQPNRPKLQLTLLSSSS